MPGAKPFEHASAFNAGVLEGGTASADGRGEHHELPERQIFISLVSDLFPYQLAFHGVCLPSARLGFPLQALPMSCLRCGVTIPLTKDLRVVRHKLYRILSSVRHTDARTFLIFLPQNS